MNATFAALLDVAYSHGGGLLKFGGDALLLLFAGDDHAARGALAAFEMRRTLRRSAARDLGGAVQLQMHVGLHSGRSTSSSSASRHRELLVAGPAATRRSRWRRPSEAGEILLSPAPAALLAPAIVGDPKGPGLLLAGRPEAEGVLEPLPDVSGVALEQAVPAPLRTQLLEVGPLEGEHRQAAIAFLRYEGVDALIEREGAEAAAEALDALVATVQAAADEHGVTFLESDVDRDGGRIILIGGAPQTSGDDEERLLRTVRAAVDAGLPLPVHVGVSQGPRLRRPGRRAVPADLHRPRRHRGARRPPDGTRRRRTRSASRPRRSRATLGRLRRRPSSSPSRSRARASPSTRSRSGRSCARRRSPRGPPATLPFVDRERERAVLAASVAPVRMGYGTLVELVGEPGIGKSRLAEELRGHVPDMTSLTPRCDQYESSTPYHPFRPLLRSLLDVELNGGGAHNLEVLAERLAALDPSSCRGRRSSPRRSTSRSTRLPRSTISTRRSGARACTASSARCSAGCSTRRRCCSSRTCTGWTTLVGAAAPPRHAAPEQALAVVHDAPPAATAASPRRRGLPPLPAMTLRLEPLPDDDAKTLVAAAFGDGAAERRGARGDRRARRRQPALPAGARLDRADLESGEQLPETVEALLATRIDRLAPADRALLRWASVLGVALLRRADHGRARR